MTRLSGLSKGIMHERKTQFDVEAHARGWRKVHLTQILTLANNNSRYMKRHRLTVSGQSSAWTSKLGFFFSTAVSRRVSSLSWGCFLLVLCSWVGWTGKSLHYRRKYNTLPFCCAVFACTADSSCFRTNKSTAQPSMLSEPLCVRCLCGGLELPLYLLYVELRILLLKSKLGHLTAN